MKTTIQLVMIVVLMAATSVSVTAQRTVQENAATSFSLEIDPATFVFDGYSLHLRIQPQSSDHFLLGAGIYAMEMPSIMVDFNKENRDKGWEVRLNRGIGLFLEHHFSEVHNQWFVGAQAGIQEYKIEKESFEGSEKFTNVLLMGYGGYTFRPFQFPVYFKAWGGLGYTSKIKGNNTLADEKYAISPITMFATLHIGYTF
jgi:hypothetical protein